MVKSRITAWHVEFFLHKICFVVVAEGSESGGSDFGGELVELDREGVESFHTLGISRALFDRYRADPCVPWPIGCGAQSFGS